MKFLNSILISSILFFSCHQSKPADEQRMVVQDVTLQQVVEDADPPPPNLKSKYKSLEDWLSDICTKEKPDESIRYYKIGLFEGSDGNIIFLSGSRHSDNADSVTIDFRPAAMYCRLPDNSYKNMNHSDFLNKITAQLKDFVKTEKFKRSFLSKANAIIIEFNGVKLIG